MGVGQARNRVKNAVERTVPFGMLIQSLVVIWYALHGHHPDDALVRRLAQPWYQTKTEPSFEDMITKLRKALIVARFTPASPGQPNPDLLHDLRPGLHRSSRLAAKHECSPRTRVCTSTGCRPSRSSGPEC